MLKDGISLGVVASHDVAKCAETWRHHLEFSAVQEADKVGDNSGIHDTLEE